MIFGLKICHLAILESSGSFSSRERSASGQISILQNFKCFKTGCRLNANVFRAIRGLVSLEQKTSLFLSQL
jgi:hypothetical protein